MKTKNLTYILLSFIFISFVNCSTFYGEPENSTGTQSISSSPIEMDFSSSVDSTSYQSLTFTNRSEDNYQIYNIAFIDNDCGAFSIFNIQDSSNNTVYKSGDSLSVTVAASDSASVNIQFSPTTCEETDYTTTLIIYYTDGTNNYSQTAYLNASVEDNTITYACDQSGPTEFYDDIGDETPSRTLPTLDDGKSYYLKISQMRAYIQPTGGFASLAQMVGTDLNLDLIPEENQFQAVYLPFTSDDEGNLYLNQVDECNNFFIPSPVTDTYFLGANIMLTTPNQSIGRIEREDPDNIGSISFEGFKIYLFSNINNSSSLIQDSDGYFGATIEMDLKTTESDPNTLLADIASVTDDDGEPFLNINADGDNSTLYGSNLRHGTVTFVGIGIFTDENSLMSSEATAGLIDSEAYLFVQINASVVYAKE